MLVLGRRKGQRIFINREIIVTVTDIDDRGQVKIGVTAAPDVEIHREEVLLQVIAKEKAAANEATNAPEAS